MLLFGALLQYMPPASSVMLVVTVVFTSAIVLALTPSIIELLRGTPDDRHDFHYARYPSAFNPVE
jgi:hypothetical protein